MVVPVWFSPSTSAVDIRQLLKITVSDFESFVQPERLILVIDGPQLADSVADDLQKEEETSPGGSFRVLHLPKNMGKGGAVVTGVEQLLEDTNIDMVMVRDADGDHVINDGPNLVRLGDQIASEQETDKWIVIGGRMDAHRPLGFIRGQYEEIVNSIIWNACLHHLAIKGKTLNTQYFAAYGQIPDCESGYKLYGRQSCVHLIDGFARAADEQPDCDASRWSSEVLPLVETLVSGGIVGQVPRLTFNEQPTSSYDAAGRADCYAARLSWLLRRLDIPTDVGRQLIDNAFCRSLFLMEGNGKEELLTMRTATIRQAYGKETADTLSAYRHGSFLC
ncbi:MAG: hypothetical protein AUJ92_02220 [Armatimonadetes bacterium CG2_30_59_28]|nr:hypothetical protein [Armatimonadota bacterium]OIO98065.1 MAG: hypothetical protein AUJ92_02220 [Armatimonadetes bacterium CG2_30_59_28]PIU67371.1 MAG: hypothetical protein COS85_00915 [Armatimonadetes bacterium CG07_land_8_20_14_0_80_59_28]PIX41962.1 MAG: hypothetical protein COZ56_10485 [Armatimonadetes bacterium CG_4_8_14_3_um_filter_58_9]PJB73797.1 MAG: hypothetical protein CO095_05435 [Armatimonadetes bacterium CG_4_9_14_3_um_filter_58_7]